MNVVFNILHRAPKTALAFLSGIIILLAIVVMSGCGSTADSAQTDQPGATSTTPESGISRPAAGTVQVIDGLGDTTAMDGTAIKAPREADINNVSVSREGDNLVFTMDMAGIVPDKVPEDTSAVEWAFMIDINGDGTPEWGVFADLTSKGWVPGLYDKTNNKRLTDAGYPGTLTHQGTILTWTVPAAALGNPQSFQWVAYTDDLGKAPAGSASTTSNADIPEAGDRVPENAWPRGTDWLPYP